MEKRGQLMGQPFIMIFALVVGALILIGGVYYISKLTIFAGEISVTKEIDSLRSEIKKFYYLEEGNSKKVKLSFHGKVKNICFYDSNKKWNPPSGNLRKTNYPVDFTQKYNFYRQYFQGFVGRNVFIFPSDGFKETAFNILHLNLQSQANNPICFRNGQEVRISSFGDHVEPSFP